LLSFPFSNSYSVIVGVVHKLVIKVKKNYFFCSVSRHVSRIIDFRKEKKTNITIRLEKEMFSSTKKNSKTLDFNLTFLHSPFSNLTKIGYRNKIERTADKSDKNFKS
jgi:hypothetical protein